MRKLRYLLCIVVVVVGLVSTAGALPPHGFDITYYSDANFTTVVGQRYYNCGSGVSSWGVRSDYYEAIDWECDSGDYYCEHCVGLDPWGNPDCHQTLCP
jgi:hypothetical protein